MEMCFDLSKYSKIKLETNKKFSVSIFLTGSYIKKIEGDANAIIEGGQPM